MIHKTVFLGDSIIEQFVRLNQYDSIVNLGKNGDKTIDIIARLEEVYKINPEQLFLLVGINDLLSNYSRVGFKEIDLERTFESILKNIMINLSDTMVYIISVLPVREGFLLTTEMAFEINQKVDQLNQYIEHVSKKYEMTFINLNEEFKMNTKPHNNYSEDGIHLSKEGYNKFFKKILNFCNNFGVKDT